MPTRMREAIGRVEYPPEQVDLVQGMPVEADNGRLLGRLDEARCPGLDHVAQWLVVRRGLADRRLLTNGRVKGGRGGSLVTDLRRDEWRSLTPALSDDALRERVEEALVEAGDPSVSFLRTLVIRIEAQRVFVEGYLAGPRRVEEAVRRLRAVEGVLEVRTRILTDPELEAAVARALARDGRTSGEAIRVRAVLGRIELLGQVSSAGVASAADRIAATVPGVPAVRTYLTPAPAQASGSRTRA